MPPPARPRDAAGSIVGRRLIAQRLAGAAPASPERVVAELGPIQAQDYGAAKWAVGLRAGEGAATEARVEEALADGRIVRVHALRGTWQLIAPADVRWILGLVGARVVAGSAPRHRELGLDAGTFRRSHAALAAALRGGAHLTRDEISAVLRRAGVAATGPRLSHLLGRAELEGLVCGGPRRGKQPTFALLEERVPPATPPPARDAAAAELARRYFRTRGPATLNDFAWWSGLPAAEARGALEAIARTLVSEVVGGRTYWRAARGPAPGAAVGAHLLPAFDEYLVAYQSRDVALDPAHARTVNAGGGMLNPAVVVGGRVLGTWRRELSRGAVAVIANLFVRPTPAQRAAIAAAARRYAAFLGLAPAVVLRGRQPAARARAGSSSG